MAAQHVECLALPVDVTSSALHGVFVVAYLQNIEVASC